MGSCGNCCTKEDKADHQFDLTGQEKLQFEKSQKITVSGNNTPGSIRKSKPQENIALNEGAYFDNDCNQEDNFKNISVRSLEKDYLGEGILSCALEVRPATKLPDGSSYIGQWNV